MAVLNPPVRPPIPTPPKPGPPLRPPAGPFNGVRPFRPPLPPIPPVAGAAATGFLRGGVAGALWTVGLLLLWNFLRQPRGEPKPPPGVKGYWYYEISYQYCTGFNHNGYCTGWSEDRKTRFFQVEAGTVGGGSVVTVKQRADDVRYVLGIRTYNYATGDYGPESEVLTYAQVGDFGSLISKGIEVGFQPTDLVDDGLPERQPNPPVSPSDPWAPWIPPPPNDFPLPEFPEPEPAEPIVKPEPAPVPAPRQPKRAPAPSPAPKPAPGPGPSPNPGRAPSPAPKPAPTPAPTPLPKPAPAPAPGRAPEPARWPAPEPSPNETGKQGPIPKPAPPILPIGPNGDPQREPDPKPDQTKPTDKQIGPDVIGDPAKAPRPDLVGIALELGRIEEKLELMMPRQVRQSWLDELANELLEKLSEIADQIGECGGGEKGDPFPEWRHTFVAPADKTASGDPVTYEVVLPESDRLTWIRNAIIAAMLQAEEFKYWRNFMAPKPNQGQPVTVIWEEILDE